MNPARTAVVSLCSAGRVGHVRNQLRAVRDDPRVHTVVVWIGADRPPRLDADTVVHVPPGRHGMRLAAARNVGAARAIGAGADVIIFLDADCIPGGDLVSLYVGAAAAHPRAILCGPVTYLPPGVVSVDPVALAALTNPHPARPAPAPGEVVVASAQEYPLFWSLSFAMSAQAWRDGAGFCEQFEGYGGEDTDFAFAARHAGVPLVWVGGSHAYHQHHPTSSPPWQHLDDILRNGALFAERWGEWPMAGWLDAFEAAGAIERHEGGWRRVSPWIPVITGR